MALVCLSPVAVVAGIPNPAGVIDDCVYATDAAAQAAWKPLQGSLPVTVATEAGRQGLRLPCNFAGTAIPRASWDRVGGLDLSACRGIEFQVLCRDASPVSYFSFYLQSGGGWFHASFYPEVTNAWQVIRLDKSAFGVEGQPGGWGQIRALRISAWRGQGRNTEFYARGLRLTGVVGVDAPVVLLRAESLAQQRPEESQGVTQFTESLAQMLQSIGLGCAVVSDLDATAERLKDARVVILPYNPSVPGRAAEALRDYARQGGKLIFCYMVPDALRAAAGVREGRHVREERPGRFATIRPRAGLLRDAPAATGQRSWNINAFEPAPGGGQVLAEWHDDQGQPTGYAALLGSTNALVLTHVLLPDDPANKERLLLAMVGCLAPDLWRKAAQAALDRVSGIGPAATFDEAAALFEGASATNAAARSVFAQAQAARQAARERFEQGRFAECLEQAAQARQRLLEAWCRAQSPLPGEFRAFWCHSAFGVSGLSWDAAIGRLASNGFNAILPNMLWGGAAYYQSKVLPVAPEAVRRGDQIAECLAAARKYGVQTHVWKVNWNLAHNAPASLVARMRRENRLQADARGREENWLCPSHPDNQRLEIESMLEVARNYAVDGLHFDYIRYPDSEHCFCAGCRERFKAATKAAALQWPRDVQSEGPWRSQWLDWRRSHITAVVRAVSEQARAIRPGLKISAAVFRNWPTDRDGIGQDWKLWCDRGWLDFVCPMDYTASARQFENLVASQVAWAGRVPCYPGIGESASSSRLGPAGVIDQILAARRQKTGGFVIFNYGPAEAAELLPMLGSGISARR